VQGVQGDAVLLPGARGMSPVHFPLFPAAAGGMSRIPE